MSESTLGSRLKSMRGDKTLEEVSARVGIAKTTLHGYESGRREPDLGTLQKLAHALGTSMAYLLGETDDPRPPSKVSAAAPNREEGIQDGDPLPADLQLYIERAMFKALEKWNRRTEDTPEDEHDN